MQLQFNKLVKILSEILLVMNQKNIKKNCKYLSLQDTIVFFPFFNLFIEVCLDKNRKEFFMYGKIL